MSARSRDARRPTPSAPLHTISILVRNKPGVLVRIALVFARRGYNIESLVGQPGVANGDFSRMTITCSGDPETLEQIIKQLDEADRRRARHRPHRPGRRTRPRSRW